MKCIIFLMVMVLFAGALNAQEQVEIRKCDPFWYVYMEFRGSHYDIPLRIGDLFREIGKQELQPKLQGSLFGIYFDAPVQAAGADSVWGLGFRISEDAEVQPPLRKSEYNYKRIATMIHTGPYESVGMAYNIIIPFIEENQLEVAGPPMEIWLDDNPAAVKPEDRRTKLIIPVQDVKNDSSEGEM